MQVRGVFPRQFRIHRFRRRSPRQICPAGWVRDGFGVTSYGVISGSLARRIIKATRFQGVCKLSCRRNTRRRIRPPSGTFRSGEEPQPTRGHGFVVCVDLSHAGITYRHPERDTQKRSRGNKTSLPSSRVGRTPSVAVWLRTPQAESRLPMRRKPAFQAEIRRVRIQRFS